MKGRLHLSVAGAVQGAGFRPFIYRSASDLRLTGWVQNSPHGLELEVEGPLNVIQCFELRLMAEAPPRASIQHIQSSWLALHGDCNFTIQPSDTTGANSVPMALTVVTCNLMHIISDT